MAVNGRSRNYEREIVARGLCIRCHEPNDNRPRYRCRQCSRRMYVQQRIPVVRRALDYYKKELAQLLEEDRAWHRKHRSFKSKGCRGTEAFAVERVYRPLKWRETKVGPGHPDYLKLRDEPRGD